jgi:uncharacterized protein
MKAHSNQLKHETSPYLLQHAHNPVHWYPWGKEALDKAVQEDKMILVSIGYSACHWCHVMERESFENEDTAAIMNEHFVNIKIDREERPDLDHIYMDAVQAISGSGGWPLNVFLTPGKKPFYGGTYFPPVRAFNRASWREVLQNLIHSWKEKRNEIEAQAENLTDHIGKAGDFSAGSKTLFDIPFESEFDGAAAEKIFLAIMKSADTSWGGFGRAPKFPQTFSIQYLLEFYHDHKSEEALTHALLSIDKMMQGGLYDQVAGGFARYSTDDQWLAPHFEKMLYDNALLLQVLCDVFQITKHKKYASAIRQTISFLQAEMKHSQGGFYAALDADSEGEEGKFYVWDKKEVDDILGSGSDLFCAYFDITEKGNWEGKNILRILKPEEDFIKEKKLDPVEFAAFKESSLQKLNESRGRRTRPGLDDKIILGWNALAVKAIARAAMVLQDEGYKQLAVKAFDFLISHFSAGKEEFDLMHTWKEGKAKYPAFLDDYAYLTDACMTMYELTFNTGYLLNAKGFCEHAIKNFGDKEELFFYYTSSLQQDIIVRKKEIYDGATPSANAVMARNLHRLSIILDEPAWGRRAENMLRSIADAIIKYPTSFGVWASLLLEKTGGTKEIAVLGKDAVSLSNALQAGYYLPGKVLMASETMNNYFPLLKNRQAGDIVQIFLCRNYICQQPFTTGDELIREIRNR